MRGWIKMNRPTDPPEAHFNSQEWPYMFTVLITSTDQEKALETAKAYHEFLHDAWNHRNQEELANVRLETTRVELM